jgi:hypothetical protein
MTELANSRDAFITVRVPRRLVDALDRLHQMWCKTQNIIQMDGWGCVKGQESSSR